MFIKKTNNKGKKMGIVYVSSATTKKTFFSLFDDYDKMPGQQIQKFHNLIMRGLVLNDTTVFAITAPPITRKNTRKILIRNPKEIENSIKYTYLPIINIPIIKNIFVIIMSFIKTVSMIHKNKEYVIVTDVLNISVSIGALIATKLFRRINIGIVTDLPVFLHKKDKSYIVRLNNWLINKYNAYILLTKEMSSILNNSKKYIILEGLADIEQLGINKRHKISDTPKICMYAGGLYEKYGIMNLIQGFILADIPETLLHIYGNGDCKEKIIEISNNNANIKYFGTVPNDEIIKQEKNATLLINPRSTKDEFVKYSFPSKNIEYMLSGTAVLTTKLPGIPIEYFDYVYTIEDESAEKISEALINILKKNDDELLQKGLDAKKFVLKYKNNKIQSQKIINLIKEMRE